MPSSRKTLLN